MPLTFLTAQYQDRVQVKALGARWDSTTKKWYVPDGLDLEPFAKWLNPDSVLTLPHQGSDDLQLPLSTPTRNVAFADKGVSLSTLLAGVSQAVTQSYRSGVWTKVEVAKIDARRGHLYLELTERTSQGNSIAQARAVIWAKTANVIVPVFERATDAVLSAGIKLLICAKPTFHPQYGFSLVVEEIDPEYTLGDLEAKKREIRARLKQEGLFDANRLLAQPWDYNRVMVVAPQGAAGLGDFEAEARRLGGFGICSFTYAFSRFQGDGAAAEIRAVMIQTLAKLGVEQANLPDAVVIIRGGGAANDLAWLNDYELAKCICETVVPVLTGIGHERDSTVLDEVANLSFDTPSKVILGIEQVIRKRTIDARAHFEFVTQLSERAVQGARSIIELRNNEVASNAHRILASAKQGTSEELTAVRLNAIDTLAHASDSSREAFLDIKQRAGMQLAGARERLPELMTEVRIEAQQVLRNAQTEALSALAGVIERTAMQTRDVSASAERAMANVAAGAHRTITDAGTHSEALMREIAGQGPAKTLERGFAIVRDASGNTVTSAQQVTPSTKIELQFRDGRVPAKTSQ